MSQQASQDSKFIDALGGSMDVARLCEVSSQAVSQWRANGIPKPRLMYLRLLRPDLADRVYGQRAAQELSDAQ